MGMVVEGVRTTKAAWQLAKKYDVNMPITNALYQVLFNDGDAKDAVDQLMGRVKTNEMEDLTINHGLFLKLYETAFINKI